MMQYCKAYSRSLAYLGTLDNAKTSYTLKDTPLSNGKIILPVDDAGNDLCTPYNFVELYDGDERVDMFRVIAMPQSSIKATSGTYTHKLEHALATLMDKLMPGTHEIGGTGVTMTDCISYILGFQATVYWQLGRCDFTTQFQYSFTDTYLLTALMSLPKQLDEPYLWTTDTTTTPWTLNLVRPTATVECEMRYRHNMLEIGKTYDASELCTRCYPRGYGEGMNQLSITSANGGVAYLDADAETMARWGTVEKPFVDKTIEHADALKRRAAQWMEAYKNPRFCYTVKALDLYRLTGEPFERFHPGKLCRMIDEEHGITVAVRVTQITKSDPAGKPGDVTVTLSNQAASVANEIADLAGRASVNELYAQGATNMFQIPFRDNADKDHPIEVDVDIPTECVRINKLWLILHTGRFRSTSRGAAAGGGTVSTTSDGGGGSQTSESGGSTSVSEAQQVISTTAVTGGTIAGHVGDTSGNTGSALDERGNVRTQTSTLPNTTTGGASIANTDFAVNSSGGQAATGSDGPTSTGAGSPKTSNAQDANGNGISLCASGGGGTTGDSGAGDTGAASGLTGGGGGGTTGKASGSTAGSSEGVTGAASGTTNSSSGNTGYSTASHKHAIGSHIHSYPGSSTTKTGATQPSCGDSDNTSHRHAIDSHVHALGGHTHTVPSHTHGLNSHTHTMDGHSHSLNAHTHTVKDHSHTILAHQHNIVHYHTVASHDHTIAQHTHSIYAHSHPMQHTHTIDSHSHSMGHYHNFSHMHNVVVSMTIPSFTLNVPAHSHNVNLPVHSHGLTLDSHTHDDVPGIYDHGTVDVITVAVDGNAVPATAIADGQVDLIPYLSKDQTGKITRSNHTITLTPVPTKDNTDGLCRITGSASCVVFIRSQGGGDY